MNTTHSCLECDKSIFGRTDKKFCNELCRNSYNNRLKSQQMACLKKINGTLVKNRKVLLELLQNNTNKVPKKALEEQGFNFSYFTQLIVNRKGLSYYFIYDVGYLPLDHGWYFLCKKK